MENPGCYRVFRDGDEWVATGPVSSGNLVRSASGRGATYQEAIEDLVCKPPFQDWLRATGQSQPSLGDFVVEDCPPENLPRDSSIADLVKGEVSPIAPHRNDRAG